MRSLALPVIATQPPPSNTSTSQAAISPGSSPRGWLRSTPCGFKRSPTPSLTRRRSLHRLRIPLREALAGVEGERRHKEEAIATFLRLCGQMGRAYWGWSQETWHRVLTTDVATLLAPHRFPASANVSQYVLVVAYLLDCLVH